MKQEQDRYKPEYTGADRRQNAEPAWFPLVDRDGVTVIADRRVCPDLNRIEIRWLCEAS